jgi:molybdenum cofactor cytidylyltransferase
MADAIDCDACLIALADMPLIPESHFRALLHAYKSDVVATQAGERIMVPALFGRPQFPQLCALSGDRGASSMLRHATLVSIHPAVVCDVDVPFDIEKLQSG